MIYYVTSDDPKIILYSFATMIPGLILYLWPIKMLIKKHKRLDSKQMKN